MSDQSVPDATLASEVPAEPESAPAAGSVIPDSAPADADPVADTQASPDQGGEAPETPAGNGQGGATPARKPARDRIAEVVAERNAERERVKAAEEAAEFWRKKALGEPTPEPNAPKPAPKLAEFDYDHDRWAEAHAQWTQDRIDAAAEARARKLLDERDRAEQTRRVVSTFEAREVEFEKVTPDYRQAVSDPRLAQFATPTIVQVLAASEAGPAISYHLAKNPEVLARISRMGPIQQAVELGRIEASVSKPVTATAAKRTPPRTAPPPPSPVGSAQPAKSIAEMDIHEYMENRTWGRPG